MRFSSRLTRRLAFVLFALALCSACARAARAPRAYRLGESAHVDGWTVTAKGFYWLPSDAYTPPDPGHRYCALVLTVQNDTHTVRYLMYERQMRLQAIDGPRAPSPAAGVVVARVRGWLPPDGDFQPGEAMTGAVGYQVRADPGSARWAFRAGLLPWSGQVTFDLGEPVPLP